MASNRLYLRCFSDRPWRYQILSDYLLLLFFFFPCIPLFSYGYLSVFAVLLYWFVVFLFLGNVVFVVWRETLSRGREEEEEESTEEFGFLGYV